MKVANIMFILRQGAVLGKAGLLQSESLGGRAATYASPTCDYSEMFEPPYTYSGRPRMITETMLNDLCDRLRCNSRLVQTRYPYYS